MTFNICRRSSVSARLVPRRATCRAPALSRARTRPWSLSRRTVNFSDERHALLSFQHLARRAPLRLGSQQQSCFGMQYVWGASGGWGVGRWGGWSGVGASVGSGSKLLEDVRRTESGSRSLSPSAATLQTNSLLGPTAD